MTKTIVVIDYDLGNVTSVMNALQSLKQPAILSRDPNVIAAASGIIIPGVGSFKHGMEKLTSYDLITPIKKHVALNRPLLGICLGMQMLFENGSEFGNTAGLGLIEGRVQDFSELLSPQVKLPHIGWQRINHDSRDNTHSPFLKPEGRYYFLHSYIAESTNPEVDVYSGIYTEVTFPAIVVKNNIIGCQFHPEKSGADGLLFLEGFCSYRNEQVPGGVDEDRLITIN